MGYDVEKLVSDVLCGWCMTKCMGPRISLITIIFVTHRDRELSEPQSRSNSTNVNIPQVKFLT